MATACKEAGRPLPTFSDDDVVDFCVTEAVILKAMEHSAENHKKAQKAAERDQFKKSHREWRPGKDGV